jgi:hypothetical protein
MSPVERYWGVAEANTRPMEKSPILAAPSYVGSSHQQGVVRKGKVGTSAMLGASPHLPLYQNGRGMAGSFAYAGVWDDITPWDTKAEKKIKEDAAAADEALYQEQLAAITDAPLDTGTGPSPWAYAAILAGLGGLAWVITRGRK